MKTIIGIKLFLVLCCNTKTEDNGYSYEVKDLQNSNSYGTILTERKYLEGDTIKIFIQHK